MNYYNSNLADTPWPCHAWRRRVLCVNGGMAPPDELPLRRAAARQAAARRAAARRAAADERLDERLCAHPLGPHGTPPGGLWLRLELPRATAGRARVARMPAAHRQRRQRSAPQRPAQPPRARLGPWDHYPALPTPSSCACACADRQARCSRCSRAAGTARRPSWTARAVGSSATRVLAASVRWYQACTLFIHKSYLSRLTPCTRYA